MTHLKIIYNLHRGNKISHKTFYPQSFITYIHSLQNVENIAKQKVHFVYSKQKWQWFG